MKKVEVAATDGDILTSRGMDHTVSDLSNELLAPTMGA